MGDRARFRPVLFIPILLMVLAFLGWPQRGYAAHDLAQSCYVCHNIEEAQVWAGSYSFWSGKAIGMASYGRPITCDICHTDYGDRFKATAESHHPVEVISDNTMSSDYDNGVVLRCKDCHNADSVTSLVPNLVPDLAPLHYNDTTGNDNTDGYPNHDVASPNNQVAAGDPPHLLSMLLSGGQRTVSGSSTYNKVPSSNPASDYAFCLACHDGSANTSRQVNVRQDYIDKGHYFTTTGGGITAGDRIPCSDCHASHDSPTNARLFEPDSATFVGTRPTGLTFANPYAPTDAEYRAVCIFCHDDYNVSNTGNGTPTVRGVEPTPRKYGIAGHAPADPQSCKQCHNPHKTPGGGPDCLTCHTPGGAAGSTYDYIDSLFKGVGPDGVAKPADSLPLTWSQHGGFTGSSANFLYTSPYDSKATNDCFKCHGERHNNTYRLIDADTGGGDSYVYDPAVGMQDNTSAGITNANAFCLTCHDGNGAAGDVQIGGQAPPNVAANWGTSGHGRPTSQTYSVSLNKGAELKCTACHEMHGSNHAKLLPAKKDATGDFALPAGMPEKTFRSGASTLSSRDLDFTDYSNPASGKGFGTAGDPGDQRAPAGVQTGLCDACHRFAGRANGGTDNVTNQAHTHEGITTDGNQDAPSQMNFAKDCLECHDTHGTTNLEMVKTTINGYGLTFTSRTGANSFDPAETGINPNVNSVCVVCHQNPTENPPLNVDHNYRTSTVNPDHNEDANCTSCHPHGNATDAKKFGFPQAACNSCHGATSDTTGMPASGDGGTYHTDANNVIGTRGGDNTTHKIHVNYLVNKRGIAAGSTCYVCHAGGGAQESHPGNPTNTSFKSGTQPTASYVQVALDNTGAVLNVQISGLTAAYSGTPGTAADNTNGWKTCSNTNCHYALSPSWSGKKQVSNYLAVVDGPNRTYPPLVAFTRASQSGLAVDNFRMYTTAGSGATTVSEIVVTGTNTANVAANGVWIYRDAGIIGTFEPGTDVQVGAAVSFSGATATFSGLSESVTETGANYWIVITTAASVTDGQTMTFRVSSVTAAPVAASMSTTATSPGTGIDATLPTSTIATSGYITTADPVTISGTAADAAGTNPSGVDRVELTIQRTSDSQYWTGSGWGALTWLAATGTASWSYGFSPGADYTLNLQSRSVDNAGNTQSPVASGSVTLDRVQPTVQSAVATDNTHVQVIFSEPVDKAAAEVSAYYTITGGSGLTVSAAVRQDATDNAVVLLTTSTQTGGVNYTVSVDNVAPGVTDLAGNVVGNPGSAGFTGYQANTLNVTNGASNPAGTLYVNGATTDSVMQQFRMAASSGTATVSQIVVTKTGSAAIAASGAHIYRDVNDNGTYEGATDTQIAGSPVSFSGDTATFVISPEESVDATGANYLVAFDIDGASTDGAQVTSRVTGVTASYTVNNTSTVSRAVSMDKTLPTSSITTSGYITTADPVTISGTAADAAGTNPSGVNRVELTIQRTSDSQYWTGSGWGALTWLAATGTGSWSYGFSPGADYTLNLQSRSVDNANNTQSPVTSGSVTLDRVLPTVSSASAVDATHVDVTYSEAVEAGEATTASNYSIDNGLGTPSAVVQQSATVFRLTTSSQTGGTSYTVTVTSGNVHDLAGNAVVSPNNTATFTGYQAAAGTLTVSQGTPVPTGYHLPKVSTNNVVVDRIRLAASGGNVTITGIKIDPLGNAADGTDVSAVKFYDNPDLTLNADGTMDGDETSLGTASFAGGQYSLTGLNYTVSTGSPREILAILNVASGATSSRTFQSRVLDNSYVTVSTGSVDPVTSFSSNVFTIGPVLIDGKFADGTNFDTNWVETITISGIATSLDGTNTRTADGSGSVNGRVTGRNTTGAGYRAYTLGTPIPPATGVTLSLYYRKAYGAVLPSIHEMYVDLVDSGGTPTTIWSETTVGNIAWTQGTAAATTGANPVTSVRLRFNLKDGNNASATADEWFDEVSITYTTPYGVNPTFAPPRETGGTTAIACNTCHQFGPDDATAGYKDSNQYYYALPGSHAKHNVSLIAGTDPANADALDTCTVCHLAATNTFGSDHADGMLDLRSGSIGTRTAGPAFSDDGTFDNASRTCSNVYCHAGRSTPQATGKSWGYGSTVCGSCHAAPPPYGKHATHNKGHQGTGSTSPTNNSGASGYDFSCYYCHYNNNHVNFPADRSQRQDAQVSFNGTLGTVTLSAGSSYTAGGATGAGWDNVTNQGLSFSDGSCTVYCHSNADPSGTGGGLMTYASPTWVTGTGGSCTICHKGPDTYTNMSTGAPQMSRGHWMHLATNRYAFSCDECHANTAAADSTNALNTPTAYTYHVNGRKNWNGQDVKGGAGVRATSIDDSGMTYDNVTNRTCTATYCHSDGTDNTAPFAGANVSPAWGAGTTSCTSCHNSDVASGTPMVTNAHGKHLTNNIRCAACHNATADNASNTALNASTGYALHVNGTRDVVLDNTYDNTPANKADDWTAGTSTCSNVKCHGGNDIVWTSTITNCSSCHSSTSADVDDFTFSGFTGAVSNVNSTEWTNTGHGRPSGTYPWPAPNTAANLSCMSSNATTPTGGCHTFSAGHDNASNFYRLAWSGTVDNASLRTFCNTCHSGTAPQVHSEGVTGYSGTNNWGSSGGAREFVCAACHDVHGDAASNNPDFMVHMKVWAAGSSAGLIPATTGLGTEPDAGNMTFDLSATPAGGDYVTDGGAVNKLCQVCHQGNAYWTRTSGALATHPNATPGRCTSCHEHGQGFKASCNTCHGDIGGTVRGDGSAYPPEGPVIARTGGTQNWAETNSTGSTVGLHQRHVVTHGYSDCATCHTSTPGSGGTHNDDGTNATMTTISTYGSWFQGTSAGVTSVVDDYCSNISCHTGAADNAYSRYWEGQALWDCFTCHGYKDQADATNNSQSFARNMTTRAHPGHIRTLANGGAEKDCVNCHATGNTTLYNTTTPPGTHRGGGVDLDFTGAPKPYGAYTPSYTKGTGFAPGTASGTCSTAYCHSIVQTASGGALTNAGGEFKTPSWSGPVVCGDCHNDDPNTAGGTGVAMSTGSHTTHVASSTYAIPCVACHTSAGDNTTLHVDGTIQVPMGAYTWRTAFTLTAAGTIYDLPGGGTSDNPNNTPGDAQYGTCSSVACHADGRGGAPRVNPTWGGTDADCTYCHGNDTTSAAAMATNAHGKHLSNGIACRSCHYDTVSANRTISGYSLHVNGTRNVVLDNTYDNTPANKADDWTAGTSTCSNVKCHGGNDIVWTSTITNCSSCHSSTSADVDDFTFSGFTGAVSNVNSTQWSSFGHAKTNVSKGCMDCHSFSVGHDNTSNFFRLDPVQFSGDLNGFCNNTGAGCHTGTTSFKTGSATNTVRNHTSADMTAAGGSPNYTWGFTPKCVDCHDPHGDESNLHMIQSNLFDNGSTLSGVPNASNRGGVPIVFTNDTLGMTTTPQSTYADNQAGFDSLCQECHNNNAIAFKDDTWGNAGSHPSAPGNPGDCTGCHKHSEAFKPSGCNGCHGSTSTGQFWPDSSPSATYPDRAGKHQEHIDAIYNANSGTLPGATVTDKKNATCDWCHPNPGAGSHDQNTTGSPASTADVHRDAQNPGTHFKTILGSPNGVTTEVYNNGTAVGQKSCGNVDCHYRVTTPSTGTSPNVGWYNPSQNADCATCHGYGTTGAALPNAHQDHVGSAPQMNYPCTYCHASGSYNTSHQDNQVSWDFSGTLDPGGTRTETYNGLATGTTAIKYGTGAFGTCANVYCHVKTPSPAWNTTIASNNCTACHTAGGAGTNPTSGLHDIVPTTSGVQHDESFSYNGGASTADCSTCHTTAPSTNHVDGTFTTSWSAAPPSINFAANVGFTDNTPPTCAPSLSGCHLERTVRGRNWSRQWTDSANATDGSQCTGCHGTFTQGWRTGMTPNHDNNWDGDGNGAEIRNNHDNGEPTETQYNQCKTCHVYNDTQYLKSGETNNLGWLPAGTSTNHGDSQITMNSTVGYTQSTWNCTGSCHTNNANHNLADSGWAVNLVAGPPLTCTSCHNGSGGGGLNVTATSPHAQSASGWTWTGTGVNSCESCHFTGHSTQTTNTVNIPNNTTMGINYSVSGGSGVYIKKYLGTETTEAQVCWSCHAARTGRTTPFEFDGSGAWYKEGTLSASSWYNGSSWSTWTSTNFSYKSGLEIKSTHDVGVTSTYPVGTTHMTNTSRNTDTGVIRCSWCHDVHGIMNIPKKVSSQSANTSTGVVTVTWNNDARVYLRGIWYSSPYNEDGAPGVGSGNSTGGFTYPANNDRYVDGTDGTATSGTWGGDLNWNATPSSGHLVGPNHMARIQSLGSVVSNTSTKETFYPALKWGVHIDENVYGVSGFFGYNPDSSNKSAWSTAPTLAAVNHYDYSNANATSEQLCMKCHGTLANLKTLWKGHNAVRGGTTADTTDIFNPRMAISQHYMYQFAESGWTTKGQGNVGYAGDLASDYGYGTASYYNWAVDLSGQATGVNPMDSQANAQGVGGGGSTTVNAGPRPNQKYHQFTCSKCHSPHASPNARLMVTNCMNRDGTSSTTFNEREGATWGRIVGSQAASDVRNILTTLPEPQNASRTISDPWIANFGGHERVVHCHNNMEQGSGGGTGTYWQSIQ